ncbi:RxLR-like protein [Phytophthora cinnamomi]|uniref:RxLR-like protein n=1 Tax=Phytophthora cinnamomi TaxID=4785 RepID=UPI003559860B|nr:RxLR-like protein [Phytophthora cinnamomi]
MLSVRSIAAATLVCSLQLSHLLHANADSTVKADAATTLVGSWEGWGTSLCWWANVFGDREDIADLLFTTKETVTLNGSTSGLPALGLNIARYNIGGSANNVVDDSGTEVSMKASDKMPAFKFMEAFWLDWMSKDPTSKSWNWDADVKQRAMVGLATKRDVNIVEAFSNSPPWWMTNNHATAGGDDGGKDNLEDWNHDQFALYLATVVSHARTSWGINFTYVEAFNEPMSTWWEYPGGQEGCHFEVDTQKDVLVKLRSQLDTLGLNDVAISSSDENSPSLALSTLTSMSSDTDVMAAIGKVNTHGYDGQSPYRGTDREPLKKLVTQSNKKFWDSEYGENDATGLSLAESIALDINQMGVSGFVYWQALDSGAWGLVQSNPGDNWIGTPNPKYYVLAQYSRHIRPGMTILSTDDTTNTVMALEATSKLLVLATVNTGDSASTVTYDLSSFKTVAGPITAWTTETSGTGALHESSKVDLSGTSFSASIPAASVMTFEVQGVAV